MSAPAEEVPTLSFDEYLTFEQLSEVRHEYVGGHVYAMSGGSIRHGILAHALSSRLYSHFAALGCRVHTHDTKLRTPSGATYYPDIFVTCRPIEHRLYDTDAEWIVEVISDSTRSKDDREKAEAYRRLPSIRGYLLADPEAEYLELRTPTDIGWHTVRTSTGHVALGPVRLEAREIFDELERLAPRATEIT